MRDSSLTVYPRPHLDPISWVQLLCVVSVCLSQIKHETESPVSVWTQTLCLGGLSCGPDSWRFQGFGGLEDSLSGFTTLFFLDEDHQRVMKLERDTQPREMLP